MIDFESYLRKVNTSKEFKVGDKVKFLRKDEACYDFLKNLRPGDKLKYIGKGTPRMKPNEILTFLDLVGEFLIIVKEYSDVVEGYYIIAPLKDFIKI